MTDLIRKRGSVKAKLSNFQTYILGVRDKKPLSELEFLNLEKRLARALNLLDEFEDIQNQLEKDAADEDLPKLRDEYSEFEKRYYEQIAIAEKILLDNKIKCGSDYQSVNTSVNMENRSNFIKLRPIDLPKFEGSYNNWLEFRDLFDSLVNKNAGLDNIQKFHYLRASLEGGAAQVIKSLEFTGDNYKVAWGILCQRYNNKRLLIFNHVKALFHLEVIQRESSQKIRQVIDYVSKHLRSLEQLEQPTDNWDTLLIFMITSKLDPVTCREWESYKAQNEIPTFKELLDFLKSRADLLETLELANKPAKFSGGVKGFLTNSNVCILCKKEHLIYNCESFLKLSTKERFEKIKGLKLCTNCLRFGHYYKVCRFNPCKKCKQRHHILLHMDRQNTSESQNHESQNVNNNDPSNVALFNNTGPIILSTAWINVIHENKRYSARALLDCGSQSSFITHEFCDKLGIKKTKVNLQVSGLNSITSKLEHKCQIEIESQTSHYSTILNCFVIPEITSYMPGIKIEIKDFNIPKNIKLADPCFFKPQKVDILIGADLFWYILCTGQIKIGKNKPLLQETRLGWIVSGPCQGKSTNLHCNFVQSIDVQLQLSKFWAIEEPPVLQQILLSKEESECEKHFTENTVRDCNGRFMVKLPLKTPVESLGESFGQAQKRFFNLEKRFNRDLKLKKLYSEFIKEYEELGHMRQVQSCDDKRITYFMPHHGILRENSITTRLRVVFDCSAPTSSGLSLNDLQMVGPVLQNDLFSILLRFRQYLYVISADVEKMYRQVLLHPDETSLQRIRGEKILMIL